MTSEIRLYGNLNLEKSGHVQAIHIYITTKGFTTQDILNQIYQV